MRRRVLAVAAAAGLLLTVLTGCHSDPRIAAYVGDATITEAQVDSVLSEAVAAVDKDNEATKNDPSATPEHAPTRSDVVAALTANEITNRALTQLGITRGPSNQGQAGQESALLKTRYAAAVTSVQSGVNALANAADQNLQPSDADLRDVYDRAVAAGLATPGQFDTIKPQLAQVEGLPQELDARNKLADRLTHEQLTVNPRYAPLDFPILTLVSQSTGQSFVAIALSLAKGPAGTPVIDTPHVAPSEALPAG
jgi:hypothetical protein